MKATLFLKKILSESQLYAGPQDETIDAELMKVLVSRYDLPSDWREERLVTGAIQSLAIRHKIATGKIDGYWGKLTEHAYSELLKETGNTQFLNSEDFIIKPTPSLPSVGNQWPKQDYASMVKFYGPVGQNQTSLILPYPMVLAWDVNTKVTKITCHEKVKDSLERIFQKTLDHYGYDAIKALRLHYFGGCLNVRKMRGGSSWSIHSWGAAVDIDPDRNQLSWGRDRAFLDNPPYDSFWKFVASEGWVSLGQAKDYDWMHIQSARL